MKNIKSLNGNTEIIKPPVEQTGEIKLLQAIIIQALHDIAREEDNEKCAKIAKTARRWLLSNSRDEFSFRWCVENSLHGYDALVVIDNIQSIIKRGDHVKLWRRLFRWSGFSEFDSKKP